MVVQPGAPWEDLEAVLHEFHQEFGRIKQEQLDLAAKKAQEEQQPFDDHVSSNL